MAREFAVAWRLGHEAGGMPDLDFDDVELAAFGRFLEAEVDSFMRFIGSREAMGDIQRAKLYGGAVDAAGWLGMLAVQAPRAEIDWVLSIAEHCTDCLALAAGGPYQRDELPTVPRNGDTRCLANCRCWLVVRTPRFVSTLAPRVGVEVTRIGRLEVDPTSDAALGAAVLYQPFADRYAWNLRMAALLRGDAAVPFRRNALEILNAMKAEADRIGHGVRMTATNGEINEQAELARLRRLEPVFVGGSGMNLPSGYSSLDDLVLAAAFVIGANSTNRGEITRIRATPPTVWLDDEPYRFDEIGGNILLVEPR